MTHITIFGFANSLYPYTVNLSGEKLSKGMEIGLTEVTFSASMFQPYIKLDPLTRDADGGPILKWFTFQTHSPILKKHVSYRNFLDVFDEEQKYILYYPPGLYFDYEDLIKESAQLWGEYYEHYDDKTIKLHNGALLSGESGRDRFTDRTELGDNVVFIEQHNRLRSNFVFIYCNIVNNRIVGDSYSQLLCVIPTTARADEIQSNIFEKITYVPVCVDNFQSIILTFRDEYGRPLTFGEFTLNLHMRHGPIRHAET